MKRAIIVCGSPGAGKTTYGLRLAGELGAVFLDIDMVTERLVRLALRESGHAENDRDSQYFKDTFREPIYQTLFDITRQNLAWTDVVITGPFTREIRTESWPEVLKEELKSEVEVHYVYCSAEQRKQRLMSRSCGRDKDKLENWQVINQYYGEEQPPLFDHVYVDTTERSQAC